MTVSLSRFRCWQGFAAGALLLAAAPGGADSPVRASHPSACAAPRGPAQQSPSAANDSSSFTADLPGSALWKDTGLDLRAGDTVEITADGQLQYADAKDPAGPDGYPRGWKDLLRILPTNEAGRGALIARIGNNEADRPFLIGSSNQFQAPVAGRLYVGINQMSSDTGDGAYHVVVRILARGPLVSAQTQPIATSVDGFNLALLDKIPRRVTDAQGDLGDMTNFILIGSEQRLRQAFRQAGWVLVDRTKEEAVLHGFLASINKQAYVEMPMSELYLFGRPQDFGFALAKPFEVAYQRHHNRVWKSPYTLGGEPVWVGAGTHDIGIEHDQRTKNGVTHKIDPDVDKEREFIAESLISTGLVSAKMYMRPSRPVGETHTATGGGFHSDGRVLILGLHGGSTPATTAGSARGAEQFSAIFCTVLEREHPDAGPWGPCSNYIEDPSPHRVALHHIPRNYRLAIVSGVLSACGGNSTAFLEGRAHLRTAHGIPVDLIPAPNGSSAADGKTIAQFLKDNYRKDGRKFILLGYSKGAVDILEGTASDPEAAHTVAALITVAGAIGGSPIADFMPLQAHKWIQAVSLGECKGDLYAAFYSLRRDVRRKFLAQHPDPGFPVYSIAAISSKAETSKILLEGWELLSFYGQPEDSQLLESDTRFPGGHDLGAVHADHMAVAIPMETSTDPTVKKLVNHNHFPRTALLEALVRYVTQDLAAR